MKETEKIPAAKIIAICNQKGGVGKTTTTINLGIGLARAGKRVLLVDVDAQGSLTSGLGYQQPDQMDTTLSTMLAKIINDEPIEPGEGILHHEEGIDLMPANIELADLEVILLNTMDREKMLKEYLSTVQDQYDMILLDCGPSLGMLTINALAAANSVIIPLQAQFFSIKGMEQTIRTIFKVRRRINPKLEIEGLLITMADMRTNFSKEIVEMLHSTYDSDLRIFQSIIPQSIQLIESNAIGHSIYYHAPSGKVAAAYRAFTLEVLG